jgi:hypothetical protein
LAVSVAVEYGFVGHTGSGVTLHHWSGGGLVKRVFLFVPIFVSMASLAFGTTFPQIALGGGYECLILVSNTSATEWGGKFSVRKGNDEFWGSPLQVDGTDISNLPDFRVNLPPRGTKKLALTGDESLRVGYLEILGLGDSSTSDIVISLFYNFFLDSVLIDSTATPPAELNTVFLLPVEKSVAVNTGFAWAPGFQTDPFDILITLFDEDGNEIDSRTLTYDGHLARFFTEVFEGIPEEMLGLMLVQSDEAIYLTALRLEMSGAAFQLTSITPATSETP